MLRKLKQHLQNGTLLKTSRNRLMHAITHGGTSPRTFGDSYYAERAATYLEKRVTQPSWQMEQQVMRTLLGSLPNGLSVLDVPFGTGRFVPYYLEKEMAVSGLDASSDMLAAAQQALGEQFASCNVRTGDARSLPYDSDTFDVVVSFRFLQTMISVEETPVVLRELHRVTKKYAILELKMRNEGVPRPQRREGEPMTYQLCEREIRDLLQSVGFSIRQVAVIGPPDSKYRDLAVKSAFLCEKSCREDGS